MKFSIETIEILKKFSEINREIFFSKGHKIETKSTDGTIIAEAKIIDFIEFDFAISDLTDFLSVVDTIGGDQCHMILSDDSSHLLLSGVGVGHLKYKVFQRISLLTTVKPKILRFDCSFWISEDELRKILIDAKCASLSHCFISPRISIATKKLDKILLRNYTVRVSNYGMINFINEKYSFKITL